MNRKSQDREAGAASVKKRGACVADSATAAASAQGYQDVARRRLHAVARAEAHVWSAAQSLLRALEVIQDAGADLGPILLHPTIGEIRKASATVNRAHALAVSLRERTPG